MEPNQPGLTPTTESTLPPHPLYTPTTPPSHSKLVIVILVLTTLISLGGLVYFYFQTQTLQAQLTRIAPSPTPSASSSNIQQAVQPSPTIGQNTSWQTYTNERFGVIIRYPDTWYMQILPNWSLNVAFDDHSFVIPEGTEFLPSLSLAFNEYMDTRDNTYHFEENTLEKAVSRYKETVYGGNVKEVAITIDDHKAYQLKGNLGPGMLEGQFYKVTLIQMPEKILIFTVTKEKFENIYDQMLKTIAFSNSQ